MAINVMTEEQINDLIAKFLSGNATPQEALLLEDWKAASLDNQLYFTQCEKTFLFVNATEPLSKLDTQAAWEKVKLAIEPQTKIIPITSSNPNYLRIAASILLVVGLSALIMYYLKSSKQTALAYSTNTDTLKINLIDKTSIKLEPNSQLVADKEFGITNRHLTLKGNAYFSVTHQDELPFIIDAGKVYIKDIGTKFSVRSSSDTDTVFVKVDEGIVLLFDSLGSEIEIKAMQNAMYIKSKKHIVVSEPTNSSITAQPLVFSNATLEAVIESLNKRFQTIITLNNSKLKNCTITTQFQKENLETIISIISETLGLSYEKTNSGYILKGTACAQ
jgi:transmembrane sensor